MKLGKYVFLSVLLISATGCVQYHSPARSTWPQYLRGASFTDMTETARIAKIPVFLGAGGKLVTATDAPSGLSYGDKIQNDTVISINYMTNLEYELYDALRKPGISVQRAGTDVVIILVRDAIMELNVADISADGADTLKTIAKILKKYDATYIEIAGYTDAMAQQQANALSLDMAQRVGVFFAQNDITTARMFIVGRGASRPIAGQDDIGRLTNRRIEIRLVPAR